MNMLYDDGGGGGARLIMGYRCTNAAHAENRRNIIPVQRMAYTNDPIAYTIHITRAAAAAAVAGSGCVN